MVLSDGQAVELILQGIQIDQSTGLFSLGCFCVQMKQPCCNGDGVSSIDGESYQIFLPSLFHFTNYSIPVSASWVIKHMGTHGQTVSLYLSLVADVT